MEAKRIRLRARKPLSDCTNTGTAITSSQSSSSTFSSSILKHTKPYLSSAIKELLGNKSSDNTAGPSEASQAVSAQPPPPASTPPRPLKRSSTTDIGGCGFSEPQSFYSRRNPAIRCNNTGKAINLDLSCSAVSKIQDDGHTKKKHGDTRSSKSCTVPRKKRQRHTYGEDDSQNTLPKDFIEQQRAYFAEVDAFELPVEEVAVEELE